MKAVKIASGVFIGVPYNFPPESHSELEEMKIISFSMKAHAGSSRFLHFFEIRSSTRDMELATILDELGHTPKSLRKERVKVQDGEGQFLYTPITITRPCGKKEKGTFYAWKHHCKQRNLYVLVATHTMTRESFLDLLSSYHCS